MPITDQNRTVYDLNSVQMAIRIVMPISCTESHHNDLASAGFVLSQIASDLLFELRIAIKSRDLKHFILGLIPKSRHLEGARKANTWAMTCGGASRMGGEKQTRKGTPQRPQRAIKSAKLPNVVRGGC